MVLSSSGKSLYKIDGNNVIVDLEGIGMKSRMLKVEVWSDKTVKIISGMNVEFSEQQSFIPVAPPLPVKFKVAYAQNNIEITTRDLIISIKEDGLVNIFNRYGNKLLIESDRTFEPATSNEAIFNIKQRYFLNVHEDIYGFGFDESSPRYNIRNSKFEMKQTLSSIASPVLFSEKGYAIIWDNYSLTTFNDQKSGLEISSDFADEIQYFFIYGPSWDEVVTEIRKLSGTAPLLSRSSFGHWSFPEFFTNQQIQEAKINSYNQKGVSAEVNPNVIISFLSEEKSLQTSSVSQRFLSSPAYPTMKEKYIEYQKSAVDKRPCIPTYANFPGVQSYNTFLVAGEVNHTWDALKSQVLAAINLPLSGQPYFATLIGGSNPLGPEGVNTELLTRWYQFAAFTPIFLLPRSDRDIFSINKESYTHAVSSAIKLRYSLLPYIYSTAAQLSFQHKTFTRSLLFDYQKTEKTHKIDQQYLFGESLMICPVTEPSVNMLSVYFPPGNGWFHFFTGKQYSADTTLNIEVTTDHIPVFVKSGSIIPISYAGLASGDSLTAPLEIRIYPGSDSRFTLYEDEGDGMGYKNGQFSNISFDYSEKDKSVTIGATEGVFAAMKVERTFRLVVVGESAGIGGNMSDASKEVIYKGKKVKIKL
jgi:alpha-glucosidase (family GH31 glycosyl hydrolase)